MRLTTLCFLIRVDEDGKPCSLLLALKKRGFGAGKWNGPGGKVEAGETIAEAARRELLEETGIHVAVEDLSLRGKLEFRFEGRSEWDNLCSVFVAERWQGEAKESEEMRPYWFAISEIPYAEMWPDDSLWLPELLAGRELGHWRFRFDAHGRLLDCEQRIEPQPPAA